MYTELFKQVLKEVDYLCMVEEVKHSTQKERRIIDTLEPVMSKHKLIVDKGVVSEDYRTAQKYEAEAKYTKSLIYQMTRITHDRGALKHDDRLDALAIAVAYWTEQMAQDADSKIKDHKDDLLRQDLENFMAHAIGRPKGKDSWIHLRGR